MIGALQRADRAADGAGAGGHADRARLRRARRRRLGRAHAARTVPAARRAPGQGARRRSAARRTTDSTCAVPRELAGGDAAHNARALRAVLRGEDRGAHRDALVLGAALALEVVGARRRRRAKASRSRSAAIDNGAGAQDPGCDQRPSARGVPHVSNDFLASMAASSRRALRGRAGAHCRRANCGARAGAIRRRRAAAARCSASISSPR